MTRLSQRNSASLPESVARPAYDRSALRRGIVHASLDAGIELPHLERALVAWLHYLQTQRSEAGSPLDISDPGAARLGGRMRATQNFRDAADAALACTSVFGEAPWPEAFKSRLAAHVAALRAGGVKALLSRRPDWRCPPAADLRPT